MLQVRISWKSCCLVLAAALVLAIFANGSSGVTAHNGATNKLHGCIGTTGAVGTAINLSGRAIQPETLMRVVDPNQSCAANEIAVDWNKELVSTIIVSPVGSPSANGQALAGVLAGITTASATNPYLVKLEPGIYDLGDSFLTLKSFVDIEGSGESNTTIRGGGRATPFEGLIVGADKTELRHLTVETSGGNNAVGIYNQSKTPTLRNVTIKASDAMQEAIGIFNSGSKGVNLYNVTINATTSGTSVATGIANNGSNAIINNSSITVSSTSAVAVTSNSASSVQIYNGSLQSNSLALQSVNMSNLKADNTQIAGAVSATGSTVTITESQINGSVSGGSLVSLANSQVTGSVSTGTKCAYIYNASFAPITCP